MFQTVFVGGLEDGIDDAELHRYFSEFGFVVRALRIPNAELPVDGSGQVTFIQAVWDGTEKWNLASCDTH